MSFIGEDLREFFDPDDFSSCHAVQYTLANGLIVPTNIFLTERSGILADGTVRSAYYEVDINRQEVPQVAIGDSFTLGIDKYRITAIATMSNDLYSCEADKI